MVCELEQPEDANHRQEFDNILKYVSMLCPNTFRLRSVSNAREIGMGLVNPKTSWLVDQQKKK